MSLPSQAVSKSASELSSFWYSSPPISPEIIAALVRIKPPSTFHWPSEVMNNTVPFNLLRKRGFIGSNFRDSGVLIPLPNEVNSALGRDTVLVIWIKELYYYPKICPEVWVN